MAFRTMALAAGMAVTGAATEAASYRYLPFIIFGDSTVQLDESAISGSADAFDGAFPSGEFSFTYSYTTGVGGTVEVSDRLGLIGEFVIQSFQPYDGDLIYRFSYALPDGTLFESSDYDPSLKLDFAFPSDIRFKAQPNGDVRRFANGILFQGEVADFGDPRDGTIGVTYYYRVASIPLPAGGLMLLSMLAGWAGCRRR